MRLKQIYVNLLNNAVNYTPDGGSVSFEVYQEEIPESNSVRVVSVISDTGIGMSEEFMKKMFVPFERETDTRINKVEGYGLGLYIVKLMNGRIEVKSKLDVGTAFKVILDVPYVDNQSVETKDNEVDYAALCSGMNLLVAEDNELNREVITALIEMNNITCDCAEDGKECAEMLSEAEEDKYDAILMDMQMPIMNGLEATKLIRSSENLKKKNIPIIAMTANASVDDVNKCFDAGMDRHIPKPVDINQLLNTLAEVCRLKA